MNQNALVDSLRYAPRYQTPFVGREEELEEITRLLALPNCRMLTIFGTGGTGKTRLSIQAAAEIIRKDRYLNGAIFLSLQLIQTYQMFITDLAQALGIVLRGDQDPEVQIFAFLTDQRTLFVLDNFEDAIKEGEVFLRFLLNLLDACPGVKLLITSRQALSIQAEWLVPIQGLPFPTTDDTNTPFASVDLFAERAARASRQFSLDAEMDAVRKICRLVEGLPLAIELAAAWRSKLSCKEIAAQIEDMLTSNRDSSFLTSPYWDVPERHKNLPRMFDHSWDFLSLDEQRVMARLSVFHSGFRLEAAGKVAGADIEMLSSLVSKSMIWRDSTGRYSIHTLLRQYVEEKLSSDPQQVEQAYLNHCQYYSAFSADREDEIYGPRWREVFQEFSLEYPNIRAAWRQSIHLKRWDYIFQTTYALHNFYDAQNRYLDWIEDLNLAVRALECESEPSLAPILAEILVCLGWQFLRLGRLSDMARVLLHSLRLLEPTGGPVHPRQDNDPCCPLGILACVEGRFSEAVAYGEKALMHVRSNGGGPASEASAYYVLASGHIHLGNYETARGYARKALDLFKRVGNRWYQCYVLIQLGEVALAQNYLSEAESYFQACYAIREEMEDIEGMAVAFHHLGDIALSQGAMEKAHHIFHQCQHMYQHIGDQGGLVQSLKGLGKSALALGRPEVARQSFRQALEIAEGMQSLSISLTILISVSELLLQMDQTQRGLHLAALVAAHPSSDAADRSRAKAILDGSEIRFESLPFSYTIEEMSAILSATSGLLFELRLADKESIFDTQPSTVITSEGETLTARELEILRLIALGKTNQQIADLLVLALSTVKWYTGQIFGKLQVQNRTQATAKAREIGWILIPLVFAPFSLWITW